MERGRAGLPSAPCFISVITLYEFCRGKVEPARAKAILEEICMVIGLENDVILKAMEIWRKLRGSRVDERDLLIASTAISKRLPLYTRNLKHFERLKEFGLRFYKAE